MLAMHKITTYLLSQHFVVVVVVISVVIIHQRAPDVCTVVGRKFRWLGG